MSDPCMAGDFARIELGPQLSGRIASALDPVSVNGPATKPVPDEM